jgi:hypothetical protein
MNNFFFCRAYVCETHSPASRSLPEKEVFDPIEDVTLGSWRW